MRGGSLQGDQEGKRSRRALGWHLPPLRPSWGTHHRGDPAGIPSVKKPYEFEPGKVYVVYADGSCKNNGKPDAKGGWAYVILDAEQRYTLEENFAGAFGVTNNQMELMAAIEAFERLPKGCYVDVFLDSEYVLKGCRDWLPGWVARGWKTSSGGPVKNEGLWHRMMAALEGKKFAWTWVKGHAASKYNNRVDELAQAAAARVA
ncbi:Rnase H [Acidovorax phage ACP17]|uniref:ribonuclease H n=1 Tax=Acidovorax phage ACP17 TaxID=2010329 RepID=A0A218M320_9CAUD|nr:Rnase H [Acidovorax phage ACP17]ASD50437.1 ribonuclease HI [Acidovorax phage ACP17]